MMKTNNRNLAEDLARRPYTEVVFLDSTTDEDGFMYVALNPELEGCMAQGETVQEARENLLLFRIDYIEHMLDHNLPVADPAWLTTSAAPKNVVIFRPPHPVSSSDDEPEGFIQVESDLTSRP